VTRLCTAFFLSSCFFAGLLLLVVEGVRLHLQDLLLDTVEAATEDVVPAEGKWHVLTQQLPALDLEGGDRLLALPLALALLPLLPKVAPRGQELQALRAILFRVLVLDPVEEGSDGLGGALVDQLVQGQAIQHDLQPCEPGR
jgi:hypothetical protein